MWCTLDDLKGIYPSMRMHRILMADDYKPSFKHQRLNPNMEDVVKKKNLKLLKDNIIYSISDSQWLSPIHVVPKEE